MTQMTPKIYRTLSMPGSPSLGTFYMPGPQSGWVCRFCADFIGLKSNWSGSGRPCFRPQKFETCPDRGARLQNPRLGFELHPDTAGKAGLVPDRKLKQSCELFRRKSALPNQRPKSPFGKLCGLERNAVHRVRTQPFGMPSRLRCQRQPAASSADNLNNLFENARRNWITMLHQALE